MADSGEGRTEEWTIYVCKTCGEYADEWHDHPELPYWDKVPTKVVPASLLAQEVAQTALARSSADAAIARAESAEKQRDEAEAERDERVKEERYWAAWWEKEAKTALAARDEALAELARSQKSEAGWIAAHATEQARADEALARVEKLESMLDAEPSDRAAIYHTDRDLWRTRATQAEAALEGVREWANAAINDSGRMQQAAREVLAALQSERSTDG